MALLWKMICNLRDPMSLRHPARLTTHEAENFTHTYCYTMYGIYRSHIANTYVSVYIYVYIYIYIYMYQYVYYTYAGHILTTGFGNCIARPLLRLATHEAERVTHTYCDSMYVIYRSHIDNKYICVYIYIYLYINIFIYKYI